MKKITAILLVLVLALSFGATALAAEGEEVGSDGNVTNGSGSTEVKVIYSSSSDQLSVTVPISITFAVKSDNTFVYPTAGSYKIVNNGVVPVHVSAIGVEQQGTGAPYLVSGTPAADGEVSLSMTAGSDTIALVAAQGTSANTVAQTIGVGAQWDIAANGGQLPINFSNGKVYAVDDAWIGTATTLFKIIYTITAGSYTNP